MLFRLSLTNIRNSLRDYSVYLITLVIAVAEFYVFNAIGGQAALTGAAANGGRAAELLDQTLSSLSVFVAFVLGLLIVYASRFLMKRRNREFALYMMLGMSKRRISLTLVTETALIGLASLAIGLVVGIGCSQLMSALVASLFDADMSAYRFHVSGVAVTKTITHFAVMYLVVMALNSRAVTHMRLIDLMQSGNRSEQVKMRNPVLATVVFLLSLSILALAYGRAIDDFWHGSFQTLGLDVLMGCVGTFLFFWSVSGFFLRIALARRKSYLRGLNAFTVRQIAAKINTVVFSLSVICVMLFFTLCMLSGAFALRNGMYANLSSHLPADFELSVTEVLPDGDAGPRFSDVVDLYARCGFDATEPLDDYVHFHSYHDEGLALFSGQGAARREVALPASALANLSDVTEVVRVSDYNELMALYGREPVALGPDQFAIVCDYAETARVLDEILLADVTADVFGHTLTACAHQVTEGFIDLSSMQSNAGFLLVPDAVVNEGRAMRDYLIGTYRATTAEEVAATERLVHEQQSLVDQAQEGLDGAQASYWVKLTTKAEAVQEALSSGALITFVCLYLGLVFLVSCGAVLALRGLTDSVNSVGRYDVLRKIGADEREIASSLLRQTGFFFLLPLLLACVHAHFGMACLRPVLAATGLTHLGGSFALTTLIVIALYGGYFLLTYLGSKRIIEGR